MSAGGNNHGVREEAMRVARGACEHARRRVKMSAGGNNHGVREEGMRVARGACGHARRRVKMSVGGVAEPFSMF